MATKADSEDARTAATVVPNRDECDACPVDVPCHWCYGTGKSVPYIQRAVEAFPLLVDALRNFQNYELTLESRQNKAMDALRVADRPLGDPGCEHGVAWDVHCCGCHSGFLFDSRKCVCF